MPGGAYSIPLYSHPVKRRGVYVICICVCDVDMYTPLLWCMVGFLASDFRRIDYAAAPVVVVPASRGTRAMTVVPCSGFESIKRCPLTSLSLSFMLVRPRPCPLRV